MKNDIKKYLTLGAVLAGSAFMVSCDGDSYTLDTPTAGELEAAKNKPVAPIPLAQYPLTSLKLSFEALSGGCVGTTFDAGDELEIDFDSIDVAGPTATTAPSAQADLDATGFVIFGISTFEGYVENITNLATTFTIGSVKAGVDASGEPLLTNLTFTPLASDLRSVSGRFIGSATTEVAFNQDTENVVVDLDGLANPYDVDGDPATVTSVTIYEDVDGAAVEVQSLLGDVTHESQLGSTNYGISLAITVNNQNCVVNFAMSKADADALAPGGDAANYDGITVQALIDVLDISNTLEVSDPVPVVNDIPADTDPVHLIEAAVDGGIEGSYRHDFDSSIGTPETIINSQGL